MAKPRVVIPVFPGTNCEYDSARAFERAGGEAQVIVMRNLTPQAIDESTEALAKLIKQAQDRYVARRLQRRRRAGWLRQIYCHHPAQPACATR